MRYALTLLALLCFSTVGFADGTTQTTDTVAPLQTVYSLSVYGDSVRSPYRFEIDNGRDGGHRERRFGSQGSYKGLTPTQSLRSVEAKEETRVDRSPSWVEVVNEEAASKRPTGWVPPTKLKVAKVRAGKDEEDRVCPPFVKKYDFCDKNYAVVFGAKWCSQCPRMYPVVESLREQGYFIVYVDTDDYPEVTKHFKIRLWPTTVVMDKGKEQARFTGVTNEKKIKKFLVKKRKEQEQEVAPDEDTDYDLS